MKEKILTIILNKDNKLLLLKGNDTDPQFHKSLWYVVTGSKESIDKCLIDTVKRQVKEETDLDIEEIIDMNWSFKYESLGYNCIEYAFISKVKDSKIKLNEESIDYEWLNLDEFINKIDWFYDKEELKERLKKILY